MVAFGVALATLVFLPNAAHAQSRPVLEGQNISTPADSMILFGSGQDLVGTYFLNATTVTCSVSTFGGDPARGFQRACVSIPVNMFGLCVYENQNCNVPNHDKVIIYGAFGTMFKAYYAKADSNKTNCNNLAWGYDPAPGKAKGCYTIAYAGIQPECTGLPGAYAKWATCIYPNMTLPQGADLTGANLGGGKFPSMAAPQGKFMRATMNNMSAPSANLWNANFESANLSSADLSNATLASVSLVNANLAGANLSSANLASADLTGANIGGANFTNTWVTPYTVWVAGMNCKGNTVDTCPTITPQPVDEPTEFFWKGSYGRGVGTVLDACPAGKNQRGALCYDSCRNGYSDNGTLTCSTSCPSGYSDRGAICHYDGAASYSPVHWDDCASRGLFNECYGGFVEDGCRGGYGKTASVCYLNLPAGMTGSSQDPTKGIYDLSPAAMVCGGGKQQDAGLCYTPCRAGYNGVGPVCWANQPSGYVDCGLGYASNSTSCGFIVTDQVVGVLSLVKDACAMSNLPGVSQACALGGSKYMQGKALAKMGIKSVSELASNSTLAARVSAKASKLMAAVQKAQPAIDNIVRNFSFTVKVLAGSAITSLPDFAVNMAKVGETFKDPATIASLYAIAQTFRSAAEDPPFKLSGTPDEQAFKIIRDMAAYYGMAVALYTIAVPTFEATPPGQVAVASADLLGTVAAYLYTVQGQ